MESEIADPKNFKDVTKKFKRIIKEVRDLIEIMGDDPAYENSGLLAMALAIDALISLFLALGEKRIAQQYVDDVLETITSAAAGLSGMQIYEYDISTPINTEETL
jgi:hypothetical protein